MRLWRRHDSYVARAFWGAFGAVLLFFTLIFVLIDLAERLKQLHRYWDRVEEAGHAPLEALARFYATMVPFVWLRIVPLAASMAGAFALARLARHQELVPLVGAGVSTRRVLMPIMLSGALLAGVMMLARATVVPDLDREHQALGRLLTKRQPDRVAQVPHVHDAPGVRLSAATFMPLKQRLEDAWITRRDKDDRLLEALRYPELAWMPEAGGWIATKGGLRIPLDDGDGGRYRFPIEPGTLAPLASRVELIEILCEADNSLGLSFEQSRALMEAHPESGSLAVRHYEQFTLPLSTLVLLGLTLPFCVRFGRHSVIPGLVSSLGMGALFFASSRILADLAGSGTWHPLVLAWLPTVIFGSLATALYAGMRS